MLLGLNPRGPTPQPTCSYQPRGCATRSRLEHVQLLNRPKLCWRRWPTKPCLNLGHGDGGWQAPMAATGLTCSWRDPSWRCGRQHPRALSNPWDTARKTFNFNKKGDRNPRGARKLRSYYWITSLNSLHTPGGGASTLKWGPSRFLGGLTQQDPGPISIRGSPASYAVHVVEGRRQRQLANGGCQCTRPHVCDTCR